MKLEMMNLPDEYLALEKDILPALSAVLKSGVYIQGEPVRLFEQELANFLNVKHVISCGNGTDALQIALMALDIKAGDEVIVPAFSYVAVAEVVCLLGAKPVFVDVEAQYFQLDVAKVAQAINKSTKAIVPVHLYGQAGYLDELFALAEEHGLKVVEDCAQALGAKYLFKGESRFLGSLGSFGCTSFFPTKNLACFGDGGALFTNNDGLANKARMIANHGQPKKYQHDLLGVNSRLDSLQAAVLQVKLPKLQAYLQAKEYIAQQYLNLLQKTPGLVLPAVHPNAQHTWHQFTIKVKKGHRDALKTHLQEKGISSMVYYPQTIATQKAYQAFAGNFPISETLCSEVLSLPVHPLLSLQDIHYICTQIKNFF
ncbi:DegT/DnrJ/EryC1/StrS family aminotransferase [Pelobium manganitolerans]|uniref:DegT/DnrJ/EryC1/StrS family aminotransferase n=1 Tax=Pelobium manganitolerans TaxID=1842495 RepID=UPI003FA37801